MNERALGENGENFPVIVINSATTRERWGVGEFVQACARRGQSLVSLWQDELDTFGIHASLNMLEALHMKVSGFNRAGPLLGDCLQDRRQKLDLARKTLDLAAKLAADHVLVFSGGLPQGSRNLKAARAEFEDTTAELLEHARSTGVKLALEPLHPMLAGDRAVLTNMAQANDICDRLGSGIGIVVDVYHVWWDERLPAEIARCGAADRIFGFHVNDWLVPTTHILRDRGMMGDGVIDLAGIWRQVQEAGYRGPIEVEIFSDRWWAQDPDVVLDTAIGRCHQIFAQSGVVR